MCFSPPENWKQGVIEQDNNLKHTAKSTHTFLIPVPETYIKQIRFGVTESLKKNLPLSLYAPTL